MARLSTKATILFALTALSAAVSAQLLGDKAASMGGAGLAGYDHNLNPARLSLYSTYGLWMPMIEYRASGRDLSSVTSYLRRIRASGLDASRFMGAVGRGGGSSMNDFGGSIGLLFGASSLTYLARGYEEILPSDGALDVYGVAYEGYQFSHGQEVSLKSGQLSVGASARMINASYDHQRIGSGGQALDAGMGARSKSGFGLDLGIAYKPSGPHDLNYALVVRNLVSPAIAFDRQMPDGTIRRNGVEP
ncbi:MAG TPA: conjugal transfer protein TraF, partial [Fimbriimonas sp.]|nr:conjugal transfer protein TraF [Fimbriimonas sp.]